VLSEEGASETEPMCPACLKLSTFEHTEDLAFSDRDYCSALDCLLENREIFTADDEDGNAEIFLSFVTKEIPGESTEDLEAQIPF
jgi:hypothetical protein